MPFYISGFKKYFEVTVWNHYTYHKSLKIFHIIVYHHSVKKKWHYTQIVHITFTRNRQKTVCSYFYEWERDVIQVTVVDSSTSICSKEKKKSLEIHQIHQLHLCQIRIKIVSDEKLVIIFSSVQIVIYRLVE